ncbi:hypothetical protein ACF0H5_006766 [Mactra antiquata]
MEYNILRNILVKQKKEEVFQVLRRWNFLNGNELLTLSDEVNARTRSVGKSSLVSCVAECCQDKGGLTMEVVGELDLFCLHMNSTKKVWNVYQLKEKQGSSSSKNVNTLPAKIKTKLMKQMRIYFNKDCCVSLLMLDGLLWGRLYLPVKGRKGYQPTRCLYFIHYPLSPVIIFNGMKVSFGEFISQCLVVALGYKELEDLDLTGHHYPSLAELALNKFSEGGYSKYQQIQSHRGPLNKVTSRKRKAPCFIEDENIIDLNRAEKKRRLDVLEKKFGEYVMPTLEKVEFRVELPYRSKEIVPELSKDGEVFSCKVRFRGTSVLEGFRNLATAGYAKVPLPKHLTCVTTRAKNKFLLMKPQNKENKTQNASQNRTVQR